MAITTILLATVAAPAHANIAADPMHLYVEGRIAQSLGDDQRAVSAFGGALAQAGDEDELARRTLTEAVLAGDEKLALAAAAALNEKGELPAEGRLLMLAISARVKDRPVLMRNVQTLQGDALAASIRDDLLAWLSGQVPATGGTASSVNQQIGPLAEDSATLAAMVLNKSEDSRAKAIARATGEGGRLFRTAVLAELIGQGKKREARDLAGRLYGTPILVDRLARNGTYKRLRVRSDGQIVGFHLALLAERLGQSLRPPYEAILYRAAQAADPDNPQIRLLLANSLLRANRTGAAEALIADRDVANLFPESVATLRTASLILDGEMDKAIAANAEQVEDGKATAPDLVRQAGLLMQARHYDAAIPYYDRALARLAASNNAPSAQAVVLMGRADAQEKAGNWPAAEASLQQALNLNPDDPLLLNYLGYSRLERGQDVEGARALIARAHKLRPDDPAIQDSLGWAYFLSGAPEKAVPLLEDASRGAPGDPTVNEHLGDALWTAGRRFEARYAWAAAAPFADDATAKRLERKMELGLHDAKTAR